MTLENVGLYLSRNARVAPPIVLQAPVKKFPKKLNTPSLSFSDLPLFGSEPPFSLFVPLGPNGKSLIGCYLDRKTKILGVARIKKPIRRRIIIVLSFLFSSRLQFLQMLTVVLSNPKSLRNRFLIVTV
jgi:hypothetical protein